MYLKDKAFKYLKNKKIFWQLQVKFHILGTHVIYLDTGRDDDDDYDDGESNDQDDYE